MSLRKYKVSYGCTTDDEMVHVSEFTGSVNSSKELIKVFEHIIKELTEDDQEIDSINVSMKLKK